VQTIKQEQKLLVNGVCFCKNRHAVSPENNLWHFRAWKKTLFKPAVIFFLREPDHEPNPKLKSR